MDFTELFKLIGLDAALWGVAVVLAVILRLARGMIHWVGDRWTFGVAVGLAGLGAVLKAAHGDPWQTTVLNSLGLLAAVLLLQFALQIAAEKIGWIPKDNEWLKTGGGK